MGMENALASGLTIKQARSSDADWRCGWFADIDEDADSPFRWQPVLQVSGSCLPLPVWFESKTACDEYIADVILPAAAGRLA